MSDDAAPPEIFDAVVIGAGIAGLATLDAWRDFRPEAKLAVVDSGDGQAGSRAPGALLHVSPGRSFAIDEEQADAFAASAAWLTQEPSNFVREQLLVRPNVGVTGERLGRSLEAARPLLARAGVRVDVISRARLEELLAPALLASEIAEAFVVTPSYAVALAAFIQERRQRLANAGVVDICAKANAVKRRWANRPENSWEVVVDDRAAPILAKQVVFACGRHLLDFVDVEAHLEGGDLWCTQAPPSNAMVTGGGIHGCSAPGASRDDDVWVVGATRYPPHAPPAEAEAKREMAEKIDRLVPLATDAGDLWRGVRLVGAQRRPIAEKIASGPLSGALAIGGFGATGLLWAPKTASDMVARYC